MGFGEGESSHMISYDASLNIHIGLSRMVLVIKTSTRDHLSFQLQLPHLQFINYVLELNGICNIIHNLQPQTQPLSD